MYGVKFWPIALDASKLFHLFLASLIDMILTLKKFSLIYSQTFLLKEVIAILFVVLWIALYYFQVCANYSSKGYN